MTASNGYRVIKAPCCGTKYASRAYMSINYSAREYWSDGRSVKSLAPQEGGLLRCICGGYFLSRHADSGPVIYNPLPLPPSDWETQEVCDAFLTPGETSRDYFLRTYDFRPDSAREQDRLAKPPEELTVQDEELTELLASACSNKDVLITARRRYWRYLNDDYRETYHKYKKDHQGAYPAYLPTELQKKNMLYLLQLLEMQAEPDYLEITELHRELGNFKIAHDVITTKYRDNEKQQALADVIANLIFYGKNQPQIVDSNESFVMQKNIAIGEKNELRNIEKHKYLSVSMKVATYMRWVELTLDRLVAMAEAFDLIDKISAKNSEINDWKSEIMRDAYILVDSPEVDAQLLLIEPTISIERFCLSIEIPVPTAVERTKQIY